MDKDSKLEDDKSFKIYMDCIESFNKHLSNIPIKDGQLVASRAIAALISSYAESIVGDNTDMANILILDIMKYAFDYYDAAQDLRKEGNGMFNMH